jgi:hypothetical protein
MSFGACVMLVPFAGIVQLRGRMQWASHLWVARDLDVDETMDAEHTETHNDTR